MSRRVLVTGAAGFIGARVVRRLVDAGDHVVAADRAFAERAAADGSGPTAGAAATFAGDLASEAGVTEAAAHGPFHTIVHLATPPPRFDDVSLADASVADAQRMVVRLLELGRASKAALVFTSTALVYGSQRAPFTEELAPEPNTPYAFAKLAGEQAIRYHGRRYGQPYTILRPGVIYGPGQRGTMFVPSLVRALLAGERFAMTGGEQLRDLVFVDDLVDLLVQAVHARREATIVNAGGGGVRLRDVAVLAEQLAGRAGLLDLGAVPYRDQEVWNYSLDGTRARELFGWQPSTDLSHGLLATIDAARAER